MSEQTQQDPFAAASREAPTGTVYTVTGQDWDTVVAGVAETADERIVVNMGPQHPSTHGVLRLILELDGHVAPHPGGRYSRMAGH